MVQRTLDRATRKAITDKICGSIPPGAAREVALFKWLLGYKAIPRRHDFIEAVIQIPDKHTGEIVPFVLNKPQRIVEAARIRDERNGVASRFAILKARQFGLSTKLLADGIESVIRNNYRRACILADSEDLAKTLLETGKIMKQRLPFLLPTKYENRAQLYFDEPINSWLDIATANNDNPCRGKTYRFLHATEPGTWSKPELKVASVNQAVPNRPGTVLSYEGTARGTGNWWYHFWWAAREGRNDYTAFFFPWFADADFDYATPFESNEECLELLSDLDDEEKGLLQIGATPEGLKWRRYHIRNNFFGDLDLFHQEFPATCEECWLSSGRPVFSRDHVVTARHLCKPPIWRGQVLVKEWNPELQRHEFELTATQRGELEVWEDPLEGHTYVSGIDVGEGNRDGDYSVIPIMDKVTMNLSAMWRGWCTPHELGDIACCLGRRYNNAYLLPEVEGPGGATVQKIQENRYSNLGRRPVWDTPGKRTAPKFGWSTNRKTKYLAINEARSVLAMQSDRPNLNSTTLCHELLDYEIKPDGTYGAPEGGYDDCVMAYAITLMAQKDVSLKGLMKPPKLEPETYEQAHWEEYFDDLGRSDDEPDEEEWD